MQRAYNNMTPLTNDQIIRVAPSVFATRPYEGMSAKYTFVPTIDVVEKMRNEGFMPYQALQSRARIEEKKGFTKHLVRFRHVNAKPLAEFGGLYPEVLLTNSHDGASAFKIDTGIYRLVCSNGLVVCSAQISKTSMRHSGRIDNIIDAAYEVVDEFPTVMSQVEQFHGVKLLPEHQEAFASAALELRYDEQAPVTPAQIVRPRRTADADKNLWNTMNVVQENIINGGVRTNYIPGQRRQHTRGVTSISENTKLNKALWTLTEKMAELLK